MINGLLIHIDANDLSPTMLMKPSRRASPAASDIKHALDT